MQILRRLKSRHGTLILFVLSILPEIRLDFNFFIANFFKDRRRHLIRLASVMFCGTQLRKQQQLSQFR